MKKQYLVVFEDGKLDQLLLVLYLLGGGESLLLTFLAATSAMRNDGN